MTELGRGFDTVADLYDEVRPRYPDELYDALEQAAGSLRGQRVLDLAAGTGIASEALASRGAAVVGVDPGEPMLRRLRARSPHIPAVAAGAEALPLRPDSFDLVTCATAWHWLDTAAAVREVRRVTRPQGHLALWWANNRWGDEVDWERARGAVYERWGTWHGSRAPSRRGVGPRDAAADLRTRGLDVVLDREFRWLRERTSEQHVQSIATHSDVIALGDRKGEFLDEMRAALAPWPTVTERLSGPLLVART